MRPWAIDRDDAYRIAKEIATLVLTYQRDQRDTTTSHVAEIMTWNTDGMSTEPLNGK